MQLFIWINKGYVKVTLPKTNCRFYFLTDVITSLYIPDVVTPDVNQYKPSMMFDFCLISPKNMEKNLQNIFIINFDLRWDKRGLHFFVGLWEWLSLFFTGVPKPYGFVTLSRLICQWLLLICSEVSLHRGMTCCCLSDRFYIRELAIQQVRE